MPENNQNYYNQEQDRRLGEIEKELKVINDELGEIQVELAKIKTKTSITFTFIIPFLTAVIGFLISKLF